MSVTKYQIFLKIQKLLMKKIIHSLLVMLID